MKQTALHKSFLATFRRLITGYFSQFVLAVKKMLSNWNQVMIADYLRDTVMVFFGLMISVVLPFAAILDVEVTRKGFVKTLAITFLAAFTLVALGN